LFRQTNRFTPFCLGKQTGLNHFVSANKPVYTILFRQTNRFKPFCFGKQTGLHHFV